MELAETASILLNATSRSLCILDELGRGTATFDGTAIAHAVTDHLVSKTRCRALFATHYHSLVDDWGMDPRVRLGHMDCIVCNKQEESGDSEVGQPSNVTFLYKLCDGSSPRSYGINVAKLAGLPDAVTASAVRHSREYEQRLTSVDTQRFNADVITRNIYIRYFERLESVVGSLEGDISNEEFRCHVVELWNRFTHGISRA